MDIIDIVEIMDRKGDVMGITKGIYNQQYKYDIPTIHGWMGEMKPTNTTGGISRQSVVGNTPKSLIVEHGNLPSSVWLALSRSSSQMALEHVVTAFFSPQNP